MRKIIYVFTVISLVYCTKENAEDLTPATTPAPTTTVASFSKGVKPILDTHCNNCHSSSGTASYLPLDTYEDVVAASPNPLLGSIKHEAGFSRMPKGASKLSNNDIQVIENWINKGTLND